MNYRDEHDGMERENSFRKNGNGEGTRDGIRLGALMNNGDANGPSDENGTDGGRPIASSIPLPDLGGNGAAAPTEHAAGDEAWKPSGAMTIDDYQRLRRGYERGINPTALQQMEEQQNEHSPEQSPIPEATPVYREVGGNRQQEEGDEEEMETSGAPTVVVAAAMGGERMRGGEEEATARGWDDFQQQQQRRQQVQAATPAGPVRQIRPENVERPRPQRRRKESGRIGPVAAMAILLVGIVGALLLYAGGAEYVGKLFASEPEENAEDLTMVTERPSAQLTSQAVVEPVSGIDSLADLEAAAEEEPVTDEMMPPDEAYIDRKAEAKKAEEEKAAAEKAKLEAAKLKAAEADRKAKEDAARKEAEAKAKKAAAARAAKEQKHESTVADVSKGSEEKKSPSTSEQKTNRGSFAVQVRATPDKSEADRIASALKSKGGSNVQVVATEKNGETVYRVRFGSFASKDEAESKAASLGYSNVWVIGR